MQEHALGPRKTTKCREKNSTIRCVTVARTVEHVLKPGTFYENLCGGYPKQRSTVCLPSCPEIQRHRCLTERKGVKGEGRETPIKRSSVFTPARSSQ